jgi:hypothetical protein
MSYEMPSGARTMPDVKIVGSGIDTLVVSVCYADKHF